MRSASCFQSRDGFTLIELLVAIALLAMSMTLVLGIHSSVFSVVAQVDRNGSFQNQTALMIDQLQRDLYGVYKGKSGFFRARIETDLAADITLFEFTTTSQLRFTGSAREESISVVRYSLTRSRDKTSYSLYRTEIPLLFDDGDEAGPDVSRILLSERVAEVRLSFKDRYGTFLDRWEARSSQMEDGPDDDRFPRLIRIELEIAEINESKAKTRILSHSIHLPISRFRAESVTGES